MEVSKYSPTLDVEATGAAVVAAAEGVEGVEDGGLAWDCDWLFTLRVLRLKENWDFGRVGRAAASNELSCCDARKWVPQRFLFRRESFDNHVTPVRASYLLALSQFVRGQVAISSILVQGIAEGVKTFIIEGCV